MKDLATLFAAALVGAGKSPKVHRAMYMTAKMAKSLATAITLAEKKDPTAVAKAKQVMISINPEHPEFKVPEGWERGTDTNALSYKQAPTLVAFLTKAQELVDAGQIEK